MAVKIATAFGNGNRSGLRRGVGNAEAKMGCHSTRKTCARGLYEASGHNLIKTQRLMGLTNPMTTARYLYTNEAELYTLVMGFNPLYVSPQPGGYILMHSGSLPHL